jgi:leader peptidase (prepilin peptidase)/N-methyltransferase
MIEVLGAALLGILIGIVINALSDDLPHRRYPQLPHYPNGVPRPMLAWSGLLAFVMGLREGPSIQFSEEEEKARGLSLGEIADLAYNTRLSWRYPLVEIGMALLLGFVVIYPFEEPRVVVWFVFLSILMLITVIDLEHRLILFVVIIPSVVVTFILNLALPEVTEDGARPIMEFVIGALVGGGLFYILYLGGMVFVRILARLRGHFIQEVAFGFGDVMLAFLCGLMIGWRAMTLAIFITVFLGAAGAILYMIWRSLMGRRYAMYTALPYGPYIVIGTVILMLFADEVREFLQ